MAAIGLAIRVTSLTIILFICYAVAGTLVTLPASQPVEGGSSTVMLLVVCALNAAVLAYIILRSRWSGWRLRSEGTRLTPVTL